jgi:putative membrane protein
MNSKYIPMVRSFTAVAALAAASFAFAQDPQPGQRDYPSPSPSDPAPRASDTMPRSNDASIGSNAGKLARADRNFLEKAAKSGMKEVEISQAVLGRLSNQSVQQFAQMMVNDHTAANNELKTLAAQKGVALTETTDRYTEKWSDNKRNVDKDYVKEMEDDHKDAIDLFEKAAKSEDPDIAAFATKTLPKLQQHLQHLQAQIKPAVGR